MIIYGTKKKIWKKKIQLSEDTPNKYTTTIESAFNKYTTTIKKIYLINIQQIETMNNPKNKNKNK